MDIKSILLKLRRSSREIEVFQILISGNKAMVSSEIASHAKLPRQTVYSILLTLVEDGLVIQTVVKKIKHFYTDSTVLSKYLINESERMLKLKKELYGEESSLVSRAHPFTGNLPKIQFYDGSLGLQRLFDSILEICKRKKNKTFRGYGINYFSYSKGLEEYLQYFIKKRASYGVNTKLFLAKGPDGFNIHDEKSAYKRNVKKLNIDEQRAGIYFIGNRIYLFSYDDNVGIMIENQAIVSMFKNVFDDHWDRVKE